jgi:hypothetical protein
MLLTTKEAFSIQDKETGVKYGKKLSKNPV